MRIIGFYFISDGEVSQSKLLLVSGNWGSLSFYNWVMNKGISLLGLKYLIQNKIKLRI